MSLPREGACAHMHDGVSGEKKKKPLPPICASMCEMVTVNSNLASSAAVGICKHAKAAAACVRLLHSCCCRFLKQKNRGKGTTDLGCYPLFLLPKKKKDNEESSRNQPVRRQSKTLEAKDPKPLGLPQGAIERTSDATSTGGVCGRGNVEAKLRPDFTYTRRLWKRRAAASKRGLGSLGMAGRTREKSMWLMQSSAISISVGKRHSCQHRLPW